MKKAVRCAILGSPSNWHLPEDSSTSIKDKKNTDDGAIDELHKFSVGTLDDAFGMFLMIALKGIEWWYFEEDLLEPNVTRQNAEEL
ncbi:hypothetical protein Tco_0824192 [Tanacetum coccineum]|uniref:Uncharacterized protein n=1 Tax=Tanacetum coccineum TaxID=301880 RepID=A0ABQ5AKZ9_9ASTR